MQKYILKWQILGIVFIFILGNILHFLFEWSGYFYPIGAIAAVNESVWEHLKLGFFITNIYKKKLLKTLNSAAFSLLIIKEKRGLYFD